MVIKASVKSSACGITICRQEVRARVPLRKPLYKYEQCLQLFVKFSVLQALVYSLMNIFSGVALSGFAAHVSFSAMSKADAVPAPAATAGQASRRQLADRYCNACLHSLHFLKTNN